MEGPEEKNAGGITALHADCLGGPTPSEKWPLNDYILVKAKEKKTFPGERAVLHGRAKATFSEGQLDALRKGWRDGHRGFTAESYTPSDSDQAKAWEILASACISAERLVPFCRKGKFESEDGELWTVPVAKTPKGCKDVMYYTLRCWHGGDKSEAGSEGTDAVGEAEPKLRNADGSICRRTIRRNKDDGCLAFAAVKITKRKNAEEWSAGNIFVEQLRGFLSHGVSCCQDFETTRPATIPLHPAAQSVLDRGMKSGSASFIIQEEVLRETAKLPPPIIGAKRYRSQMTKQDMRSTREAI